MFRYGRGWQVHYGPYAHHFGIVPFIFCLAVLAGLVVLVVLLVKHYRRHGTVAAATEGAADGGTPLDILNQRYARGEIDKAEYTEKKKDLTA
ncbi:MAG: SHOCT domain-containing protein [Actinobacteria bacterium]|nr:SHOCT domain-containing protein [Actinomycetota bacterium]